MPRINHFSESIAAAAESIGSSQQGSDWEFKLLNEDFSLNSEIEAVSTAMSSIASDKKNKELETQINAMSEEVDNLISAAKGTYRYVLNFRNRPGGQNSPILPMSDVDSIKTVSSNRQFGAGVPPVTCWLNVHTPNGQVTPVASVRLNSGLFLDQIEKSFQKFREESGVNIPVEQSESMDTTPFTE